MYTHVLSTAVSYIIYMCLAAINVDTDGRVCGALVQFGCYQHML